MAKLYITPQKLLTMELGADFDTLDDVKLASLCSQATTLVDAYCAVPRLPQVHDFRGGTVTEEVHEWRYPESPFDLGQRRMFLMHRPITAINQFRIYVSAQPIFEEIAPVNLVINPTAGYFDIVALALMPSGLFNALIVPNVGLFSPISKTSYSYGWDFEITGEVLYATDASTFRAENQFWQADPVIYKDNVEVTSGITLDLEEGTVTFDTALSASEVVTADYHHRLPNDIMQGAAQLAAFLRAGANIRSKGLERLSSIAVAEVKITRAPSVRVEDIDELIPEAAMFLSGYRYDGLVVR